MTHETYDIYYGAANKTAPFFILYKKTELNTL